MGGKNKTNKSGGGGGQDRGQNVTHQSIAAEQRKQREARKQKQLAEGKKQLQDKLDRERYGAGVAYGSDKISKDRLNKVEMYGGKASKYTNEYLESIGEAKRLNPYYDHKGKITGYSYQLTSQGKEMKYGKSGGAMGSGDPTGIMTSTAISQPMWKQQQNIQKFLSPMSTLLGANKKSYDNYIKGFYNIQEGKSSASMVSKTTDSNDGNFMSSNNWAGTSVNSNPNQAINDSAEVKKTLNKNRLFASLKGEKSKKFLETSKQTISGGMARV